MRVRVTGTTGFGGARLAETLAGFGHDVRGTDRVVYLGDLGDWPGQRICAAGTRRHASSPPRGPR